MANLGIIKCIRIYSTAHSCIVILYNSKNIHGECHHMNSVLKLILMSVLMNSVSVWVLLTHHSIPFQAGLVTLENPKQLTIALEPEAASIYCRKLRLKECIPDPLGLVPPSASPSPSTGAPKYSSLSGIQAPMLAVQDLVHKYLVHRANMTMHPGCMQNTVDRDK